MLSPSPSDSNADVEVTGRLAAIVLLMPFPSIADLLKKVPEIFTEGVSVRPISCHHTLQTGHQPV